jgi:hypothetical protein
VAHQSGRRDSVGYLFPTLNSLGRQNSPDAFQGVLTSVCVSLGKTGGHAAIDFITRQCIEVSQDTTVNLINVLAHGALKLEIEHSSGVYGALSKAILERNSEEIERDKERETPGIIDEIAASINASAPSRGLVEKFNLYPVLVSNTLAVHSNLTFSLAPMVAQGIINGVLPARLGLNCLRYLLFHQPPGWIMKFLPPKASIKSVANEVRQIGLDNLNSTDHAMSFYAATVASMENEEVAVRILIEAARSNGPHAELAWDLPFPGFLVGD